MIHMVGCLYGMHSHLDHELAMSLIVLWILIVVFLVASGLSLELTQSVLYLMNHVCNLVDRCLVQYYDVMMMMMIHYFYCLHCS